MPVELFPIREDELSFPTLVITVEISYIISFITLVAYPEILNQVEIVIVELSI